MNRWLLILLVFSLTVNLAAVGTLIYFSHRPAPAGPEPGMAPGPRGPRGGEEREPWMRSASLTAEQRQRIRDLRLEYRRSIGPLAARIEAARGELMRHIAATPPASDSLRIILDRINRLQGELELATVNHLIAMRPFMDAESWQLLTQRLDARFAPPRGLPLLPESRFMVPGLPPGVGGRRERGRRPEEWGAPPGQPPAPAGMEDPPQRPF